jgi:hypothetical protein
MEMKCIFNIGEKKSILAKATQVSDVAHGPLFFFFFFLVMPRQNIVVAQLLSRRILDISIESRHGLNNYSIKTVTYSRVSKFLVISLSDFLLNLFSFKLPVCKQYSPAEFWGTLK